MGFKMKSGNKVSFKNMGATEAIKQVDTSRNMHTEKEIYKAKLRGDYQDLTGDKLKKASYDDPSGTVVSRDPHYLDSPNKQKTITQDMLNKGYDPTQVSDSPVKQKKEPKLELREPRKGEFGYFPKSYTKKDIEFLKEQKEDVVRSMDYLTRTPNPTTKAVLAKKKKSPAKGKGDNLKRIMAENKAAQKKAGTWYKKDPMPKDFNVKGSRTSTTPRYNPNMPKSFNIKGSSASTTPKYSSTKAAKDLVSKKPTSILSNTAKTLQNTPKQYVKTAKNIGKKALKGAGRLAGGLGVAATLYDFYKSGQKHSGGKAVKGQKSFMADAKKKTKSIYKKK